MRRIHMGWGNGRVQQLPPPRWYGIYDDSRRLLVGINYIVYAMTH